MSAGVNSPLVIAVVVIAGWSALGLVVLIGKGSELIDRIRAHPEVDEDEPIPSRPAATDWDRHVDDAIRLAHSAGRWSELDDLQVQRWARTHPTN